ncbi:MAG: hypothetical protein HQL75_01240 [Magnetococcales bacterium]|nr:hypothetical protein [Magnetococcales bacterium]
MNTAERIYYEVKCLPDGLADRVLDFVLFLEQRHEVGKAIQETDTEQGDIPVLDTREWRFNREQANAR